MAFTFAHPAAAVPLRRLLGRAGVLSALVVGSVVPDLRYFVPLPASRDFTHGLLGLFGFCLPMGLVCYVAFHRVLKQPLCALLPLAWQARLAPLVHAPRSLPEAPWWAVCVSILAGALTHLIWDPLTHGTPSVTEALPFLGVQLFTLWAYAVYVHSVLYHASSLLGMLALGVWSARWLRRAEPVAIAPSARLPEPVRIAVLVALVAAIAFVALGELEVPQRMNLRMVQRIAVRAGVPSLSALGLGVLLYCTTWHALRAARRRARP